jgi:hypothetical protein
MWGQPPPAVRRPRVYRAAAVRREDAKRAKTTHDRLRIRKPPFDIKDLRTEASPHVNSTGKAPDQIEANS